MILQFFNQHFSEIILTIGGLGAWIFEHSKRKEALKEVETRNVKAIVEMYQEALHDFKKRSDETIAELKERYDFRFVELEKDVKRLRDNVNLWKGKYSSLKKEFDDYRSKHKE